ncbi:MAG: hypothetical protein ACREMY_06465, partial [bacterium]
MISGSERRDKQKRKFFVGYGGTGPDIQVTDDPVPQEIRPYHRLIARLLLGTLAVSAALPWFRALLPPMRLDLMRGFTASCSWSPIAPTLVLWHAIVTVLFIGLFVVVVATFPYSLLPRLARRFARIRDIFFGIAAGILLTTLFVMLVAVPGRFCSFGGTTASFGADIMRLTTSSLVGLSIVGPLLWSV